MSSTPLSVMRLIAKSERLEQQLASDLSRTVSFTISLIFIYDPFLFFNKLAVDLFASSYSQTAAIAAVQPACKDHEMQFGALQQYLKQVYNKFQAMLTASSAPGSPVSKNQLKIVSNILEKCKSPVNEQSLPYSCQSLLASFLDSTKIDYKLRKIFNDALITAAFVTRDREVKDLMVRTSLDNNIVRYNLKAENREMPLASIIDYLQKARTYDSYAYECDKTGQRFAIESDNFLEFLFHRKVIMLLALAMLAGQLRQFICSFFIMKLVDYFYLKRKSKQDLAPEETKLDYLKMRVNKLEEKIKSLQKINYYFAIGYIATSASSLLLLFLQFKIQFAILDFNLGNFILPTTYLMVQTANYLYNNYIFKNTLPWLNEYVVKIQRSRGFSKLFFPCQTAFNPSVNFENSFVRLPINIALMKKTYPHLNDEDIVNCIVNQLKYHNVNVIWYSPDEIIIGTELRFNKDVFEDIAQELMTENNKKIPVNQQVPVARQNPLVTGLKLGKIPKGKRASSNVEPDYASNSQEIPEQKADTLQYTDTNAIIAMWPLLTSLLNGKIFNQDYLFVPIVSNTHISYLLFYLPKAHSQACEVYKNEFRNHGAILGRNCKHPVQLGQSIIGSKPRDGRQFFSLELFKAGQNARIVCSTVTDSNKPTVYVTDRFIANPPWHRYM